MVTINEKVSIIVPIYNAEKYLEECIASITDQTYKNLQIILVNDGSKDKSWKICQELEKSDDRITALTQKNSGVSVARNKGMNISTGRWVMFVDPDDVVDVNIVERLINKVDEGTDIVACSCYGFNEKEKIVAHFFKSDRIFKNNKNDLYLQLFDSNYGQSTTAFTAIGVPWGKIYRREFIEKNSLRFDPKLRRMQDNVFNMYAFNMSRKIYYLDEPLYFYRLEHINNYVSKHFQDFEKIFLPVIEAKYTCLKSQQLDTVSVIYKAYIIEAANVFFNILNSMIFLNKDTDSIKNKIRWLITLPCFKILFNEKEKLDIHDRKLNIKLFLIKHQLYRIYALIVKLTSSKK